MFSNNPSTPPQKGSGLLAELHSEIEQYQAAKEQCSPELRNLSGAETLAYFKKSVEDTIKSFLATSTPEEVENLKKELEKNGLLDKYATLLLAPENNSPSPRLRK